MQKILCAAALLAALTAGAGENKYLGQIIVSGASLTNVTTAVPFAIPAGAKVTLYCTAAAQVLVDNLVATTTTGLPVSATTLFPTSVGKAMTLLSGEPTALISVIGTATCSVWIRDGSE